MSEIDYEQEVRDVLAFYEKHGRSRPPHLFPDAKGGRVWMSMGDGPPLPGPVALDLLTMDLLRWAREAYRAKSQASLTIQMDDGEWYDVGVVSKGEHYFIDECEQLHRALMAAIIAAQEVKQEQVDYADDA